MKQKFGLSTAALKTVAFICMFIDHAGMILFPDRLVLRVIGRLAFPIFAYQIAQGASYTKNFKKYALRLLGAALLAEIPFNLVLTGRLFSSAYQSVMLTLFLGLLCCGCVAAVKEKFLSVKGIFCLFALPGLIWAGELLSTDYGSAGILTVLLFYLSKDVKWQKLWQFGGMFLIHVLWLGDYMIHFQLPGVLISLPLQGFALLSLLLLWLDDGTAGRLTPWGRKALYLFYPLHLLLLYGLSFLF